MANRPDELTVLKALGDETRYAMYRELATSTAPLSAPELADRLGLHANTVRLHLDRLRDAGLIDAEAVHRGTVGRPQHLYFLADGAPGLGFDPPAHALLAGLLASLAERVGADADDAADTGHAWGAEAGKRTRTRSCVKALDDELAQLGFEPAPDAADGEYEGATRIEFLHCPFRELAEAYPELVCNLHRGLCEGVVDQVGGGRVEDFATLYDPEPCHVIVSVGYPEDRTEPAPGGPMLTLTDTASTKVKELLEAEENPELVLRVAVRPGGCSGLSYEMFFDSDVAADDVSSEFGGVKVVVDPASSQYLTGASLDYKDGLQGAGFTINNPNTTRTCGCGQSFS